MKHFPLSFQQLYEKRLCDLGVQEEINRTRLKEKILEYFPRAQEHSDGKSKYLIFEQGMQQLLRQTASSNYEHETLLLAKVAKILRREIAGFQFNGTFSVSFKTFVAMLVNGVDLNDQGFNNPKAILTIRQTIFFNFNKRAGSAGTTRHSVNREPPLSLYIGMKIQVKKHNYTVI